MTITLDTATQLEALATTIFSPATLTGLTGQDDAIDAQYIALIAPVMLAIDNRVMAPGFKYSLNVTNALQGRPKHWFMSLDEYNAQNSWMSAKAPCACELTWVPNGPPGSGSLWVNSLGNTIALATMAAICNAWATAIRTWLEGQYTTAVNPPPAAA